MIIELWCCHNGQKMGKKVHFLIFILLINPEMKLLIAPKYLSGIIINKLLMNFNKSCDWCWTKSAEVVIFGQFRDFFFPCSHTDDVITLAIVYVLESFASCIVTVKTILIQIRSDIVILKRLKYSAQFYTLCAWI